MANETVEQIHDELKRDPLAPNGAKPWTHYLADRILAAHKREIAAKDAEITQLRKTLYRFMDVTGDCRKCEECGDESCPWYGEPCGCNNRVARDKFLDGELVDPLKTKDAEIASLRSLVNELADALLSFLAILHNPCSIKQCREECSVKFREMSALVAKAREVCDA